ncbi:MAG TPA: SDR family NAD(P)-dependent oxidoreductase [Solirubrobacteraceae bacterium]
MQISGSTVLLTGATGGIGHTIARVLGGRGAKLILTGRRGEVLGRLAAELGARALTVDLSDRAAVDQLALDAADADILIANAALPTMGTLDSVSLEQIDSALDVNLRAPIVLARALTPRMIERGSGHLVFISSLSGKAASPRTAMYNTSKFGVRGLAGALRADLHGTGVGVSTIFPGFISDAGMFVDAGVKLPPGVGTKTPEEVAAAVVKAIERNRAELDVAPLGLRGGTAIASLAPQLAATVARKLGSDNITRQMHEGQHDKR